MRVRTDHLGKVALFGLVLHLGVTIGRHGNGPLEVVLPPPLEAPKEIVSGSSRAQRLVPASKALLPAVGDSLPEMGSRQFDRQMREMGLHPDEVRKFAQMMETQDLSAFRK
ncbi:MAG: hypothetical protein ACO1SV_16525 [Fimbriimonas sp.]